MMSSYVLDFIEPGRPCDRPGSQLVALLAK